MIGLILGATDFPKEILKKAKKLKIKNLIIDLTSNNEFKKERNSYHVSLGKFGKIINILNKNKCKKVLFAGKVKKPNFSKLKLDLKGLFYLPRIIKASKLGHAAILKEIIKILIKEKIKVVNSNLLNPELTLLKGNYTNINPSKHDLFDIKKGIRSLSKLNAHNHVQGLVIRNKTIIATENLKGTKTMLNKIKKIKNRVSGILIKFPKKKQDLRVDLPTVGLDTLKDCKKAGLKGIVVKEKKNILLNKKGCIRFANKNGIFIKAQ
jgi:UDP-2,3-diacylglucosamine hydrolase